MIDSIQIHSLTKKFGDITAVNNLNVEVKNNTIFGLVGPDGAGKTTTMRMLCSLLTPDKGTAKIGGYDILTESNEIKNHIGYMPQKFSLYGDLLWKIWYFTLKFIKFQKRKARKKSNFC
jgi:ABC-2 type transport system ATP-binding protein